MKHHHLMWMLTLGLLGLGLGMAAQANDEPEQRRTADQVADDLEARGRENPLIDPVRQPAADSVPGVRIATDRNVVGHAPDARQPTLRAEGEFIVNRRGRLVRSRDGFQMIFVFDADGQQEADTPMVVMPCRMLQNMEDLVRERGDSLGFILSGQVFTYRGANYLLPTKMQLAIDKGNLKR